jgi:two-component system, OmpR family, sensor histidine kinase VicK
MSSGTEIIKIPSRTTELLIDLVKSAKEEVLLLVPTSNSFLREERIGIIQLLKEAAVERKVKVRILTPINSIVEKILQKIIVDQTANNFLNIQRIEEKTTTSSESETNVNTVTIVVVDRKASLVIEKVDDSKQDLIEAIGLATYSTSKPTVLSYVSIFENLSNQAKLHEQLKAHNKMQEEFINIAAHELRTPIQPIIGLTETLLYRTNDREQSKLLEVVNRNAKRLQRLTEDILDVTKIESKSLHLRKERFNLIEILNTAIGDSSRSQVKKESKYNIRLELHSTTEDIFVEADKSRIYQVILNLLDNAIKFINEEEEEEGVITITAGVKREDSGNGDDDIVIVSVKDNGQGIDPDILPRLFTKFATKSQGRGTGLGLFISKSIIEAHGGKIWAENNRDARGATFSFTLPLSKK